MNKKFLSAILFGAMLATSAGTFVSCKDYDDDIKGLQTQIDTNKNAIAELQKLVGAGNWVTSVAASGENLVVTMSNGTTATIAGIKGADGKDGVDGKNAAEWTISEDGFWCKDGEKTTNVAVAQNGKDGKDGATAPSPTISDNGMWVVYSWDAEKGEFVAEETEIPAAGTTAYAVEANGIYTLHIADENGEYQEIVLPATCDSFVVEAPFKTVESTFENTKWTQWNAKTEAAKAMLKVFPELGEIAKNTLMKQGGSLPVIVNPANVDLTDGYSFSLQKVNGEISEAIVGSPVKGMNATVVDDKLVSRSAEECIWTLSVEPALNERGTAYVTEETEDVALVVKNAKGTTVKTAFAYTVLPKQNYTFNVYNGRLNSIEYAEEIDILAAEKDGAKIFDVTGGYADYFVLEVTNALTAEKYGLSVEGGVLKIANMPANVTEITVPLKLTYVGLNGDIKSASEPNFKIVQTVAASSPLSTKTITLSDEIVKVRWDINELSESALALDNILSGYVTIKASYEEDKLPVDDLDGEVETYVAYNAQLNFYNAKGKELYYTGGKWYVKNITENGFSLGAETTVATFGFDVDATEMGANANENWLPTTYTITVKSTNGAAVIYSAETEMEVSNPTTSYIKLVSAFVNADGVFQITGTPSGNDVLYTLKDALIYDEVATLVGFEDMDYDADQAGEEEFASYPWIGTDGKGNANAVLSVNKWMYKWQDENNWIEAEHNQLDKVRNIRAEFALFNSANKVYFPFQVVVKSEIYDADPTKVFTLADMSATFGDATPSDKVADNAIDLTKLVTKAVYAAGADKGKAYSLFTIKNGTSTSGAGDYFDYTVANRINNISEYYTIAGDNEYVLDANRNRVEIAAADFEEFGMSYDKAIEAADAELKFYLTYDGMTEETGSGRDKKSYSVVGIKQLYATWSIYYKANGDLREGVKATDITTAHAPYVTMFDKYVVAKKGDVIKKAGTNTGTTVDTYSATMAEELTKVEFEFVEPAEAAKYFQTIPTLSYTGETIQSLNLVTKNPEALDVDLPTGKATVKMKMYVTCDWGKIMEVPFELTLKTVK